MVFSACIILLISVFRIPSILDFLAALLQKSTLTVVSIGYIGYIGYILIFNRCGEFRWSPEGPVSQTHSPHPTSGLFRSFKICPYAKERHGKQREATAPIHPSKTATLVPEFAVEDLPLGRTAALVPEFAVKDLPLGWTLWWWYA